MAKASPKRLAFVFKLTRLMLDFFVDTFPPRVSVGFLSNRSCQIRNNSAVSFPKGCCTCTLRAGQHETASFRGHAEIIESAP
jgi:hypothetical protein